LTGKTKTPEIQCPKCGKWNPVGGKCECRSGWAGAMASHREKEPQANTGEHGEENLSNNVKKFIAFVRRAFNGRNDYP